MKRNSRDVISIGIVLLILACLFGAILVFDLEPRLGLDLQGGIGLVFKAKPAKGTKLDTGVLDKTVEKIRDRVDKLGVAEPEITRQGAENVVVQLPGINDPERAKELVGTTAQLQFRIVEESKDESEVKDDESWKVSEGEEALQPEATIILPYKEDKAVTLLKLGPTLLTGDAITKAQLGYGDQGDAKINFELGGEGKGTFGDITTENVEKRLAIVLDYEVESAPNIKDPITDGHGEITGDFTTDEANDLVIVLNTGALPVELELIQEQEVSATLGSESLNKGLVAGLVGLLIVALFMLFYYRAMGVITCMGLLVFGGLMYGFICVLGEFWSLSIAGIAGIIVAIGIAADSSIVYFERLKEEVRDGRTLRSSVDSAYKSAFRTILAADTVSFTAAAILYIFAVGSVKGFAFTLGMATVFDVFISYVFVRPVTALMAQWKMFGTPAAMGIRHLEEPKSEGGSS